MEQLIEYQKSYKEYKAELDSELQRTAEGFVRIGYLLKVARDTNVLAESGYKTVAEFAEAEYNLDKTQVSRFISINDKFSEGGYSDHLLPTYQGFGYAKLTLMLQLPDAVNEALTPSYSKAEIQSIKEELDEEKKTTDLEIIMEAPYRQEKSLFEEVIYKLCHDEPALFACLHDEALECSGNMKHFQLLMAPSGEKTYSVRVTGIGRILLMLNDASGCRAVNSRTGELENITWQQLREACEQLTGFPHHTDSTAGGKWTELYGEPYPLNTQEKAKVAPVQQNKTLKNESKEARKEVKVQKAKTEKPKTEVNEPEEAAVEEQIPGQTNIETDFPELMPEPLEKVNDIAEIIEPEPTPATSPIEQSEPETHMSNRDRCRQALHRYIDSLDDEGMFSLIGDMEIQGDGILTCSACGSAYGVENCHISGECERRFKEWINK